MYSPEMCPGGVLGKDSRRNHASRKVSGTLFGLFGYSELDFSSFEVEDEEKFFEQQLRRVVVSLAGSPRTESPLPPPLHPPPHSPPHLPHTLSPSHTPGTVDLTHSSSSLVLSSRTLTLPDTPVGHFSGKHQLKVGID